MPRPSNLSGGSGSPVVISQQPLEIYAATGCLKNKLCCSFEVQRWPFLMALAWEAILLDFDINTVPRNNWCLAGYQHSINQLQTSPTPPLPLKTFSLSVAHCTACPHCIQFGAPTSAVLHAVVCPHIICIMQTPTMC